MIVKKEDGTLIYQGLIFGTARLIPSHTIKVSIERRENIGRFLTGILLLSAALQSSGNELSSFTIATAIAGLAWIIEFFVFTRKLPVSSAQASTQEIDIATINKLPIFYAYFILIIGFFGICMSAYTAITAENEVPIFFPILIGAMSVAMMYVGVRFINGKKSNNSFQG